MDGDKAAIARLRDAWDEGNELGRRHAAFMASVGAVLEDLATRSVAAGSDSDEVAEKHPHEELMAGVYIVDPPAFILRLVEATHNEQELRVSTGAHRVAGGLDPSLTAAKVGAMGRGAVHRVLYDESTLDQPDARHHMRYWADAGEQQRIVRSLPAEFLILGSSTAVILPPPSRPDSPVAIVQAPAVVAAYTALFEFAWDAGVPDPTREDTVENQRLMTLLERGYKDEAIARHLGVSLRTVRRRVAAIMAEAGVSTRFQLGHHEGRKAPR